MAEANESEALDLIVTVKAYPQSSEKYGEAVCVAGIRLDAPPSWVRLYPIEFRDLPWAQRFRKYDRIRLEGSRRFDDRPESYYPDERSIEIVENVSSSNGWARRRELIEGIEIHTMCDLQRRQEHDGTSLGMVAVAETPDLEIEERSRIDLVREGDRLLAARRDDLFGDLDDAQRRQVLTPLEPFPFYVRYVWSCGTRNCSGHRQSIIDWELVEAWRSWRRRYSDDGVWDAIRRRWIDEMFADDRTTFLFAGNMHARPKQFLVLGVFWPRIRR